MRVLPFLVWFAACTNPSPAPSPADPAAPPPAQPSTEDATLTITETTQSTIGGTEIGVSNIWEREYTLPDGTKKKGLTAKLSMQDQSEIVGVGSTLVLAEGPFEITEVHNAEEGHGHVTFQALPPSSEAPDVDALALELAAKMPEGSGDYSHVLALATLHEQGHLSIEELTSAIVARQLKAHPLGVDYLFAPAPSPPPGVDFDPARMPSDWTGTWGEVAMAYHLGKLTREQADALHASAFPSPTDE